MVLKGRECEHWMMNLIAALKSPASDALERH